MLVERLAQEKAEAVALKRKDSMPVLGSDTLGLLKNEILVKPESYQDFCGMMKRMSGNVHTIHTAIAIAKWRDVTNDVIVNSEVVTSEVEFAQLTDADIETYWQTGEPQDKAGGYGIQGFGGQYVKQIKGSYSAIVGLPLYETKQLIQEFINPKGVM